jgi:hypothetical protein
VLAEGSNCAGSPSTGEVRRTLWHDACPPAQLITPTLPTTELMQSNTRFMLITPFPGPWYGCSARNFYDTTPQSLHLWPHGAAPHSDSLRRVPQDETPSCIPRAGR